jgi:hypothetical protein
MTIEVTLERIAVALERIGDVLVAKTKGELYAAAVDTARADSIGMVLMGAHDPRAQTIAPAGAEMSAFSSPGTGAPLYAIEARNLANDPQFQTWAANRAGIPHALVPDAVALALTVILKAVVAKGPEDFKDDGVIQRFVALRDQFSQETGRA